jgi:hypothetical protein
MQSASQIVDIFRREPGSINFFTYFRRKWSGMRNKSKNCCGDSSDDDDWRKYYDYSTFHGVRDWCHASSWFMRILWTITLIFAVGVTFSGCAAIISEYLIRPVVVSYVQVSFWHFCIDTMHGEV